MQARLTTGPVLPSLLKMAAPMSLGIVAMIAFNLADTWFIAQLGPVPLAAVSFTFPVVFSFASLAMGLGQGTTSVISRAIGESDPEKVRRLTTDALLLALMVVGASMLLGYATLGPLFRLLGANEKIRPLVLQYMHIWYGGLFFTIVPMVGNSAIRASGDMKYPALIMTLAALGNVVLDPILIFGLFGFPPLGLAGAAWATLISRAATLVASVSLLHFKYGMLDWSRPNLDRLWTSWKPILKVGLPAAGSNLLQPLSIGVITALVAHEGVGAVAGYGIAGRIEALALVPLMGLGAALGPFAGQNWGANQRGRVAQGVYLGFGIALVWGLVWGLVGFSAGPWLVRLFQSDPAVVSVGAQYLALVPFGMGFFGVRALTASYFNALGRPLAPTLLVGIQFLVLQLPLAFLLQSSFGLIGLFGSTLIAYVGTGTLAALWTRRSLNLALSQSQPGVTS
ncbi:MAG: MATE family efflux transporter [bacterium]|nr:MATE family efflux transporter [bacterium]